MQSYKIIIVLSLVCICFACSKNAVKEFEKGNNEKAYEILYKKAKKEDITREEKRLLQEVILELVEEDSISLFQKIHSPNLDTKMKGYTLLKDIKNRHEDIIALRYPMPSYNYYSNSLYDSVSYDVTNDLYYRAKDRLQRTYDSGDKIHARNAHTDVERIPRYHVYESYPLNQLKEECIIAGTTYTLVELDNDVRFGSRYIDEYFDEDEIRVSNTTWNKFHFRTDLRIIYDRVVEIVIDDADLDDDTDRSTKTYTERIITDYNEEKDTSGNVIQVPVYGNVSATVTTERIERELVLRGEIRVQERTGNNVDRKNIRESYKETIDRYSYTGDERALPNSVKNKINGNQEQFSREENFYKEAIEEFLDEAEKELRRYD